ncbi:NAD(P)H-binding protein [Nocardia abscessus]|uniref:NAD(P)H-binding protein n=1 Tax=Nocardia abscessus TaxID=120957 RepID=UPI00313C0644
MLTPGRHALPADRVGVIVRDTDRAGELADRGVRVRRGDFTDPQSLAEAFEGATRVLINSPLPPANSKPTPASRHTCQFSPAGNHQPLSSSKAPCEARNSARRSHRHISHRLRPTRKHRPIMQRPQKRETFALRT